MFNQSSEARLQVKCVVLKHYKRSNLRSIEHQDLNSPLFRNEAHKASSNQWILFPPSKFFNKKPIKPGELNKDTTKNAKEHATTQNTTKTSNNKVNDNRKKRISPYPRRIP